MKKRTTKKPAARRVRATPPPAPEPTPAAIIEAAEDADTRIAAAMRTGNGELLRRVRAECGR